MVSAAGRCRTPYLEGDMAITEGFAVRNEARLYDGSVDGFG